MRPCDIYVTRFQDKYYVSPLRHTTYGDYMLAEPMTIFDRSTPTQVICEQIQTAVVNSREIIDSSPRHFKGGFYPVMKRAGVKKFNKESEDIDIKIAGSNIEVRPHFSHRQTDREENFLAVPIDKCEADLANAIFNAFAQIDEYRKRSDALPK